MKEELEKRDLSTIPTAKLVDLVFKYNTQLSDDFPAPDIKSDEKLAQAKSLSELVSNFSLPS